MLPGNDKVPSGNDSHAKQCGVEDFIHSGQRLLIDILLVTEQEFDRLSTFVQMTEGQYLSCKRDFLVRAVEHYVRLSVFFHKSERRLRELQLVNFSRLDCWNAECPSGAPVSQHFQLGACHGCLDRDPHRDTLRILVATDSHLGYLEKDELRGRDSFDAFNEVCSIAAEKEVDFLLLGGDLFHENKPSRTTLVRTIEILRRYCLNDRPVRFQVVSDQTINFPNREYFCDYTLLPVREDERVKDMFGGYGHVNYEDPNFNVGLPVFSIHGNHDDPAGVDNLSAIDILASCNLLNYFGKADLGGDAVGQVTLHPILLRKGSAKVALYGLGNIRDERLNRMFQTPHGVQWIRPASQDDCSVSDWFNVFVIHQNRVKANPKNAISETFLASFLDFVIWGHEHECLIDPQEVPGMGFHVTQPGSSVATSLIEGEAAPKHVLLLEIKGKEYRGIKIPLQSVRPFCFADVCLKDNPDIDPNDPESVQAFLTQKVHSMIAEVPKNEARPPARQVPLVRLRVDYSGYSTINAQRFGQQFVGKVANPNDILLFTKAARERKAKEGHTEDYGSLGPEEMNQENIEALVAETIPKMEILPVAEMGVALQDFVNKDEKQAFHVCVQDNLDRTQTTLAQEGAEKLKEEKDVVERVILHLQQREVENLGNQGGDAADIQDESKTAHKVRRGAEIKVAGGQGGLQDFSDDEEIMIPKGRGKAAQNLGAGSFQRKTGGEISARGTRGRGSRGAVYKQTTLNLRGARTGPSPASARATPNSAGASSLLSVDGSDEELTTPAEDPESEEIETTTKGRKRATRGRGGKAQEPRAKRGRKSATPAPSYIEDDVEDDDDEPTQSRGRGATAIGRATRKNWGALRR